MCNSVSNLCDGSTDVSINEQEVVYVRYVYNGEIETDLIDIVDLKSSWAQGVKVGLNVGLEQVELSFEKLLSEISDQPTSVMHGLKSGTMKLILTACSIA